MACRYNLGQKSFSSEIELDEYLLNNKDAIKEFGDEVFSKNYTTVQNQTQKKLIESNEVVSKLFKEGKIVQETTVTDFSEDHYTVEKPYFSVTKFLREYQVSNLTDNKVHPLFPVFNLDEYFKHKALDWRKPEYWKTATEEEIRDVFGDATPHAITTKDEIEFARKRIENKWKHQGYLGTALHDIMNQFWMIRDDHLRNDLDRLTKHLKNSLTGPVSKHTSKTYQDVVPEPIWRQMAEHCQRIYKELDDKFGGTDASGNHIPPKIMSEIGLSGTAKNFDGEIAPIVGIADLVVIDHEGNIQLIDYKTSPKSFGEYDSSKRRTFHYQLAVYRRLLQNLGLNINRKSGAFIIPFKFENFYYDQDTDTAKLDAVLGEAQNPETGETAFSYLEELPILTGDYSESISANLDEFLPIQRIEDVRSEEISGRLQEFMKQCFPTSMQAQELTDDKVKEMITKQNGFKKDPNTGKFSYKLGKNTIYKENEIELISTVKNELNKIKNYTADLTQGIKRQLEQAQKTGILDFAIGKQYTVGKFSSETWLKDQLSRYATQDWKILDGPPILEQLGVILVLNKFTRQINVIKVSNATWQTQDSIVKLGGTDYLDVKNNKNSTITGNFESDIIQRQKPKNLIMESTYGNIELMQTMAILNMLPKLFYENSAVIGEVMVMDPRKQQGSSTTSKQLLYNFNELMRLNKKVNKTETENHFQNETIKMLSLTEMVQTQFKELLKTSEDPRWASKYSKWNKFKDATSNFDQFVRNPIKLRTKLLELIKRMEEHFPELKKVEQGSYSELERPERRLYYYLHAALAEVDGVDYTQQVRDHDKYLENSKIYKEGWSGTMMDNPTQMSSETLNHVAKQVNVAYQNVRNDITKLNSELRNRLNKLKQSKNFGWAVSRTIGNQTDLYENMYDRTVTGDLRFKNPWDNTNDLTDDEREFLMFAILKINGDRNPGFDLQEMLLNDPDGLLQVPLTIGSTSSQISARSLLQVVKDRLQAILPKNLKDTIKKSVEGLLTEEDKKAIQQKTLWEMTNMFDASKDGTQRERTINYALEKHPELGLGYFEQNLEALLLKHSFAYSLKTHMDSVFPTIKAAMLHLSMQGAIMNDQWVQDVEYLEGYIKNKIFNLPLDDEKWDTVREVSNFLMSGASKLALAFNPRQLYQAIDGLWKDISLIIRKPDGDTSFTKDNMQDAFFWIYKDMMHFGDTKSMAELINEQYGLNDMDMNSLVEKISSDNVGIYNFWNIAFRFASRPDFYNRMTIFGAQMRGDGCFEAHSVVDGKLVYDWAKDKRFDLFANHKESEMTTPEQKAKYNQQKALYIAMARQFMAEHAVNDDGTEFVLDITNPKPLPRAYTVQQSESMKSLSDLVYGYYSHEKKSLVQSTTLGAMIMQMATYWSSKKNQWLAPGGVKQMGHMEHYKDDEGYWYQDENGNPTRTNTGIPYYQWKGQYQEGILITVTKMITDLMVGDDNGNRDLESVIDKYWNHENENLQRAYRNNLKQLLYDLLMGLFLGALMTPALLNATKEHVREVGNNDFANAFANNCMLNVAEMLDSSTDDFNAINSIFGRASQWTPFAVLQTNRILNNISNLITGDKDLFDAAVQSASATRTQEPIWDFIKISTLGREIGDNGETEA